MMTISVGGAAVDSGIGGAEPAGTCVASTGAGPFGEGRGAAGAGAAFIRVDSAGTFAGAIAGSLSGAFLATAGCGLAPASAVRGIFGAGAGDAEELTAGAAGGFSVTASASAILLAFARAASATLIVSSGFVDSGAGAGFRASWDAASDGG